VAKRVRIDETPVSNNYFTSEKSHLKFVSSGCTLLDCALGGGWVVGRVVNVVGDKSTAKTALATEALINFTLAYPEGTGAYRECEAAYDKEYAEAMGLPIDKIDFGDEENPLTTVEAFARDLEKFCDRQAKLGKPGMYVLDSLDALSDEAEMERDIGEGTFGAAKAKQLSTLFRTLTSKVEKSNVLLFVVSQVRDNIGAMFGEKHKRSGGKALDFYCSQIVWLAHTKILKRTIKKVERPYGVQIRAKVKKNKVAMPFRECDFEFHFGYGVEDVVSNQNWLKTIGRDYETLGDQALRKAVKAAWNEIETDFLPKTKKYET